MNKQQIKTWLDNHAIEEVECIVPNMMGCTIGKFIPAKKFLECELRIAESALATTVLGDYPDNQFDYMDARDIDTVLKADYATARLVPWAKVPTAQVIHDCFNPQGELHPVASRSVLKRVLDIYAAEGWTPVVAPEMEFYLVDKNTDPSQELRPPVGLNGRRESAPIAYSMEGVDEYSGFVHDLQATCKAQSITVEGLVHEMGMAQYEINFIHGDALKLADQVFAFKRTVNKVAAQHGFYATFMAKPYANHPGSAMHIHQSVVDTKGNNIFVDAEGRENTRLLHFIGGMQKYTPYCFSIYAPNSNAYKRYKAGFCAPANMQWGYDNRSVGLRVPESNAQAKRVENRFPGADSNPYLAIAASLACGYLGVKQAVDPETKPHQADAGEEGISVPRDLLSSVSLLDNIPALVEVFGSDFVQAYQGVKRKEFEESIAVITPWEREHLLLSV